MSTAGGLSAPPQGAEEAGAIAEPRKEETAKILRELTIHDDGGTTLPNLYVVSGKRIIDLSGLSEEEQIFSLGGVELSGCPGDEKLILIGSKRTG